MLFLVTEISVFQFQQSKVSCFSDMAANFSCAELVFSGGVDRLFVFVIDGSVIKEGLSDLVSRSVNLFVIALNPAPLTSLIKFIKSTVSFFLFFSLLNTCCLMSP